MLTQDPKTGGDFVCGGIIPGFPHLVLQPRGNTAIESLVSAAEDMRKTLLELKIERLLFFSTQWPSIIGHQIQARAEAVWTHVDPEWHELGSLPYAFAFEVEFAKELESQCRSRGLQARCVDYPGFPIDTGTVVAQKLLNPDGCFRTSVLSCNIYSDRAETTVLGKATRDAVRASGLRTALFIVSPLSARLHACKKALDQDGISFPKDEEWNLKVLELLSSGRLEDVSQLARQLAKEAHFEHKGKALWWLSAACGQTNALEGEVYAYAPLAGAGLTVCLLRQGSPSLGEQEFDEDSPEFFRGDRNVLSASGENGHQAPLPPSGESPQKAQPGSQVFRAEEAPEPVGAYPHARREGDMLYLSGIGPRNAKTGEVTGGPIEDSQGQPRDYDIQAQTEAVIANVRSVLQAAGATLEDVVDVTCYLVNMRRDFKGFNEVYKKHFTDIQATRTTVAVSALPTPIAVEFKVIARSPAP